MNYFSKFPLIDYDFSIGYEQRKSIILPDVLVRLNAAINGAFDLTKITMDYYIVDSDRLENISHKLYGKSEYHWTIAFVNKKYNYIHDYPMSHSVLEEYAIEKYGSRENLSDVHHYVDDNGKVISGYEAYSNDGVIAGWVEGFFMSNGIVQNGSEVSNMDYENQLNDAKRLIRVISPTYIIQFTTLFDEKMRKIRDGINV